MILEVYETLSVDDQDHPAAAMFDAQELVDAIAAALGRLPESDEEATVVPIIDEDGREAALSFYAWTGKTSACVSIAGPFPARVPAIQALQAFVLDRDLMLYDPIAETVFNNRRSYS